MPFTPLQPIQSSGFTPLKPIGGDLSPSPTPETNPLNGTLLGPLSRGISDLGTLYSGGEQGIASKLAQDVQAGAQDIGQGNIIKGIAKAGFRTTGDIAGTIYAPFGAAIGATGLGSIFEGIQSSLEQRKGLVGELINKITDIPAVQDFAIKHPNAGEDFGRALNLIFGALDKGKIEPSTAIPRTIEQIKAIPPAIGGAASSLRPTAESIAAERQAKLNKGFAEQNVRLKTAGNAFNDNTIVRTDETGNKITVTPIDTFAKNNIAPVIDKGSIQMGDYRLGTGELGKIKTAVSNLETTIDTKLVNSGQKIDLETLKQEAINKAKSNSDFKRSGTVASNIKKIETRFEDYKTSYGDSLDIAELNNIRKVANKDYSPETIDTSRIVGDVARGKVYEATPNKEIRGLLQQEQELIKARDYAETINGTKVVGGKLGNYALRTAGAIAGTTFEKLPVVGPILGMLGGEYAARALQQTQFKSAWTELKALLQSNNLEPSQTAKTTPIIDKTISNPTTQS